MTTEKTEQKNKGQPSLSDRLSGYTLNTLKPVSYEELALPKQCNCDLCRTKPELVFEAVA